MYQIYRLFNAVNVPNVEVEMIVGPAISLISWPRMSKASANHAGNKQISIWQEFVLLSGDNFTAASWYNKSAYAIL